MTRIHERMNGTSVEELNKTAFTRIKGVSFCRNCSAASMGEYRRSFSVNN